MKRFFLILFLSVVTLFKCYADRIYIVNSPGYNTAEPQLINAITNNGHSVVVDTTLFTLPLGFTSTCIDPVNGYDWLCFFGDYYFSGLLPQIQSFINSGGKVFYQYEVSCCTGASSSIANILSGLTGMPITPNSNNYVAYSGQFVPAGWKAANINCCVDFFGDAYKGLDGLPLINQLQATSNLNASLPSISACLNFGFFFATTDFIGTAHKGAIVGIGDVNIWYNGDEPFWHGGITPINTAIVKYFFPNDTTKCYLLPPKCIETFNTQILNVSLGKDTTLCQGETLPLNVTTSSATYQWQDNSKNPTYVITQPGTYWVKVTNNCGSKTDTIIVNYKTSPTINLGNDTTLCTGVTLPLNATSSNATYIWQDNSTNPTYTVTQQGTYWVKATNYCGSKSDTINVSYILLPTVNLGKDTILCQAATLLLNATSSNATYTWQDNSTNPTYTVTQHGTYWVKVTNTCGSKSDTISIYIPTNYPAKIGNDTIICIGDTIILSAVNNCSWCNHLWSNGTHNLQTIIYPTNSTTYQFYQTDSCSTTSDAITVNIEYCKSPIVVVPNIFTPNNDQINDVWLPQITNELSITQYSLTIYDRWGLNVFETAKYKEGWDGRTRSGTECSQGTYYYIIRYTDAKTKQSNNLKGFLQLSK